MKINLDFETYSEADLKKVGVSKYANHPSTEILCLAYSINEGEPHLWLPWEPFPKDFPLTYLMYAFNAEFEINIWNKVGVKKYGFPKIDFNQWRDTQAQVLLHSYPAELEKCGEALGLNIVKDKRGKELIRKLCRPQTPSKNQPHRRLTPENSPELFQELYEYCKQDVRAEIAVSNSFPFELDDRELTIWRNCLKKNELGIPIDIELVDRVIDITEDYVADISAIIPSLTNGCVITINQRDAIIAWAANSGYKLPDLTKNTVDKALEDPEIGNYPLLHALLQIRQVAGKNSTKKYKTIKHVTDTDGRARNCFQYHAASTGREGGRLIQPQNLPRASIADPEKAIYDLKNLSYNEIIQKYTDIMHVASALIRPTFRAPKGKTFIIADYTSIELIKICWLAGQEDILQLIINGLDVYIDMATDLYDLPYDQIPKNSEMRQFSKTVVLGGVYGLAHKTFRAQCAQQGIIISDKQSKDTINKFRKKYNMVRQFWYDLEKAAIEATLYKGKITNVGYINFIHKYDFLFMFLPNGKPIAYPHAELKDSNKKFGYSKYITHMGVDSKTKKWSELFLTPGRLAENATQGSSAQVMYEAANDLTEQKHDVFLTVHDELGAETDEKNGLTVDRMVEIMCDRSNYFAGLPLYAEGYETKVFKKG